MSRSQKAALLAQISLFLLGISGSVYAALTPANSMVNWYSTDDAFFYFKVAQNVLSGHGFTFDQINLTNGFHPLWMLCCLLVFWVSGSHILVPLRLMILFSGLLNGLTGIFLFRLLSKYLHYAAAILGAVVWMLLPSIFNNYIVHGMESALSGFFLVLLLWYATSLESDVPHRNIKLVWFGLIAALTILSRLDNLFVAGMVGIFVVFRITRIPRLVIYDLVAVLLGSIIAWIVRFGTNPTIVNNYSIHPLMITTMFITPMVMFFCGGYSSRLKASFIGFLLRLGIAGVLIIIMLYIILTILKKLSFNFLQSQSLLFLVVILTMGFILVIRLFFIPQPSQESSTPWQIFVQWINNNLPGVIKDGVLFSLPIVAFLGSYMLYNKHTFGTYSPISGQVKTWWGSLTNTVYYQNNTLVDLLGLTPGSGSSPWSLLTTQVGDVSIFVRNLFSRDVAGVPIRLFIVFIFIVFILLVVLLSRKNGSLARRSFSLFIPALTLGCFLQIAYYAARAYGQPRSWYWVAESLLLVLLGALFSSKLFEKIRQWTGRNLTGHILLMIMVGFVLFLHSRLLFHQFPYMVSPENETQYLEQTRQLEKDTTKGARIGMTGGGMTSYFIQGRTIVNLDGLINSLQYFEAMKNGTAAEFLNTMKLDYVFGNPYMLLESDPYREIFEGRLSKVVMLPGHDNFTLYRFVRTP